MKTSNFIETATAAAAATKKDGWLSRPGDTLNKCGANWVEVTKAV